MHKKFEINRTKIKGGCQSGRKVVTHNYKSDLPLVHINLIFIQMWSVSKNTYAFVCVGGVYEFCRIFSKCMINVYFLFNKLKKFCFMMMK